MKYQHNDQDQFHQCTTMAKEMDISIQFYEGIGLTLKRRWDNHYAMVETGGMVLRF